MLQRGALLVSSSFLLGALLGAQEPDRAIPLHFGALDPAVGHANVPAVFQAPASNELYFVQSRTRVDEAFRASLRRAGAQVHRYVDPDCYVVRANAAAIAAVREQAGVRGVAPYHIAYKLEPRLAAELLSGERIELRQYVVVMIDPRRDEAALAASINAIGGAIMVRPDGNLLLEAQLSGAQLMQVAALNTVEWIQIWTAPGHDMDNVRIQGGANYVEAQGGFTGKGVRGHIMEGIVPAHVEFAANAYRTVPQFVFNGASDQHGNATFGCVFAGGASPQARATLPDGQGFFTNYNYIINTASGSQAQNSRWGVVKEITDPTKTWKCMFQTASWGYTPTSSYEARSAEMDWIIFNHDIPTTQSQSNTGNTTSRPQAWAKNIISIGGLSHFNTANPGDDRWTSASTGPATDTRIKPELCAYYDQVYTTYSTSTTGYGQFSGTSSATPICAGHVGLAIEMFTDGLFGYPQAPSWQNRFPYRAHFTTTKALLVNTARQYQLTQATRYQQGWGFPAVHDLYDLRNKSLVVDELDVLQQGQTRTHYVYVPAGTAQFRSTMIYADVETAAANYAGVHRVNDLDLRVADLAGSVVYHGNNGLRTALVSTPGGSPDNRNTVENVIVPTPAAGIYQIDVSAPLVAADSHLETPAVDADFALVVSGIGGGRDRSGSTLDFTSSGAGNLQFAVANRPATWNEGFTFISAASTRPYGNGNLFGLELDALTLAFIAGTAADGNPFHFTNTSNPALFPNAPFVFPAGVALAVQGITFDAVTMYLDNGNVAAVTNVSRVTVQ